MNQASQLPSHASICSIVSTRFFCFSRSSHSLLHLIYTVFSLRFDCQHSKIECQHMFRLASKLGRHIRPHICHINRNIVQANRKVAGHNNNNNQNRKKSPTPRFHSMSESEMNSVHHILIYHLFVFRVPKRFFDVEQ